MDCNNDEIQTYVYLLTKCYAYLKVCGGLTKKIIELDNPHKRFLNS